MVEKLSDSEKLVLRLQSDLQFVLKDKASLLAVSSFQSSACGWWIIRASLLVFPEP